MKAVNILVKLQQEITSQIYIKLILGNTVTSTIHVFCFCISALVKIVV
jgi:hypothetical protein